MIYERQYKKVLSNEILRYLLLGRLPNIEELSKKIASVLGTGGNTIYQFVPQEYKSKFNIFLYNQALRNIKFDLDVFYEELLDLFSKAVNKVTYAEVFHKVHSHELSNLKSALDNILFTVENADFYFLGAYDNFSDRTKIDLEASTESVIDSNEQVLSLPYGGRGTSKIDMSHMYSSETWPITVLTDESKVIVKRIVPSTSFKNIFIDNISVWNYEIKTSTPDPVEIRMRFPLQAREGFNEEILINRIELCTHSTKKQKVTVRLSNDDVNYLNITGYEQGIFIEDPNKIYAMDFSSVLTEYVEISIRKNSPDSEIILNNTKQYQYIFGLKGFGAYKTGRLKKATYQSKPFVFEGESEKISKISLSTISAKPQGTQIKYSVGLFNNGEQVSDFLPINPVNNPASIGVNEVVQFNTTQSKRLRFTVEDTNVSNYGEPFQGKEFYRIGPPINPVPVFGTASMYRGYNNWYRDKTRGFQIKNISDVFVPFNLSETEAIYDTTIELPLFSEFGERKVRLELKKPPYYNSDRGHLLKPDSNSVSNSIDVRPNYAIYSVKQLTTRERRTVHIPKPTSRTFQIGSTNVLLQSSDPALLPVLYDVGAGKGTLRRDIDYVLNKETIGGVDKFTGYITIPQGSALLDVQGNILSDLALRLIYTADPDILHKVEGISGNYVYLKETITFPWDYIEIQYRYIPVAPDEIIKSSVRVSKEPATGSTRTFYTEGVDYAFDPRTGAIQRISTGSIPSNGSVFVQFSYRNAKEGIQTFQTWCNVGDTESTQIKFLLKGGSKENTLVASKEVGEGFYVNTPDGLIDITNAPNTPKIGPGWVQFIVRSKDPDANPLWGTNLIDQVIQFRDENQKRIFKEGGLYFREITAFLDSMKQKTLNHLKVNTLKLDHSNFAIDDTTDPETPYIVVNFLPGYTEELYNRGPSSDLATDARPENINEVFLIIWDSKIESETGGNAVAVRIDLSRNDDVSDGGVTPKVYEYHIRAAF